MWFGEGSVRMCEGVRVRDDGVAVERVVSQVGKSMIGCNPVTARTQKSSGSAKLYTHSYERANEKLCVLVFVYLCVFIPECV